MRRKDPVPGSQCLGLFLDGILCYENRLDGVFGGLPFTILSYIKGGGKQFNREKADTFELVSSPSPSFSDHEEVGGPF